MKETRYIKIVIFLVCPCLEKRRCYNLLIEICISLIEPDLLIHFFFSASPMVTFCDGKMRSVVMANLLFPSATIGKIKLKYQLQHRNCFFKYRANSVQGAAY